MTREDAIEYNKNLKMYMKIVDKDSECKFLEENYIALDMAIEALKQPIRLKGHWIKDGDDFKCDKCGHVEYRNGYNFCSSCGADMREVK